MDSDVMGGGEEVKVVKLKKHAVRLVPALAMVAVVVTAGASVKWG